MLCAHHTHCLLHLEAMAAAAAPAPASQPGANATLAVGPLPQTFLPPQSLLLLLRQPPLPPPPAQALLQLLQLPLLLLIWFRPLNLIPSSNLQQGGPQTGRLQMCPPPAVKQQEAPNPQPLLLGPTRLGAQDYSSSSRGVQLRKVAVPGVGVARWRLQQLQRRLRALAGLAGKALPRAHPHLQRRQSHIPPPSPLWQTSWPRTAGLLHRATPSTARDHAQQVP
mmetsp:Transcript_16293/g.44605  ORF Transcript_16293/g.44605 Transcript_16293/m.44605 type:complete len:223 (-) Transcript_16293:1589-2257(-)